MAGTTEQARFTALGRYQIEACIAEGGMGTVYRARDPFTGQTVALKVLLSEYASSTTLLKRFRQEFKAASTLHHPHLVRALDFGQAEGQTFLVLEYVNGISLGETIERHGRLAEADALRVILQAASALQYVHNNGLLHRDVKPDNILLSAVDGAKLTDLGLAKYLDADIELTRPGKGLGTPYFMAPEQIADAKTVDQRADVYGLAATLYIAVTGELPFRSRGYHTVFKKKSASEIRPPRSLVPQLSERLDFAILRALSADPQARPASCGAFVEELTGKLFEDPTQGRKSYAPAAPDARERRTTVRYPSRTEGVCLPLGGSAEVRWSAQVRDISASGISLVVNRRFEPGTILTLEFAGQQAHRPERLLVRVIRVTAQPKRKWIIGCKFGHGLAEVEVAALQ